MLQVTSKLTTALAGVALASLPILVGAQGGTTPQQPSPPRATSQQNRPAADQNAPQHHLVEGKRVLNSIDANALKGEAKTQIVELRSHFAQLEHAWQTKAAASARTGAAATGHAGGHTGTTAAGTTSGAPGAATAGTTGTPEQAGATGATARQAPRGAAATGESDNWMTHYQAIDTILDRLLADTSASTGAGVSAGVSAGTTAGTAAGTAGTTGAGRTGVSAGVSASADVTLDAATKGKLVEFRRHIDQFHTTAMSQSRPGEEDAASASATSGITGSMTQTKPSTAQTQTSATATEPTPTTSPASAPASSMTADSVAIAKLTAQIDELIGSASTSSTSGAVGTSGTAASAGTVCVDRAKLEQLKRDIQALQSGPRQ